MQTYWDWCQDQFGNGVEGVTVSVFQSDGVTLANIYDAETGLVLIDNPIATDVTGFYSFAAPNGTYIVETSGTGFATWTSPPFILYDAVFGTPGTGSVTSVALSAPGIFTVAGSPVTTTGTLALSLATQSANTIFAGPTSGGAATPAFRPLHANDISALIAIGVTVPSYMSVADATLGPTDTLALDFDTQAANLVFAGPASGGAAAVAFRALVPADYPVFVQSGGSHAVGAVPDPGSTAGTTKFLCEDATWKNVPYKMQFQMSSILAFPALTVGTAAITPTGDGSLTISANSLQVGSRIKVTAILSFTNGGGTGFLNSFECKLGGGSFLSAVQTVAGDSSNQLVCEWDYLVDSATSYRFMSRSQFCSGSSATTTQKTLSSVDGAYVSFDITTNQAFSFQYSINTDTISAASILRCEILIINPA
jgi:hypothetical protein